MDSEWKKFYDKRVAMNVDEHLKGFWTRDGYEQLLRVTLKIARELDGVKNVLDVGCGVGRYCHELSKLGYRTVGVDYSEKAIEQARRSYPTLEFDVSNGYELPFDNDSFDLVMSIGALQCLVDYRLFLSEMCRVSSKYVVISTLYSHKKIDLEAELKKKLEKDSWPTREYHPEQITSILEELGFSCKVITHEDDRRISDGFFVVATKC